RDEYISGTSCTVVLCGIDTFNRKYVDWEIKATLDKQHGLLGVLLPTHRASPDGKFTVPDRLHDNIQTGYAHWISWTDDAQAMIRAINLAREKARTPRLIANSRSMMGRNR
ncbi:MAG: TIR domain-containing protein, partial [Anaerolineae bacterium]|nr:TIR domain-containing protein [Anaerolineae bacterium]